MSDGCSIWYTSERSGMCTFCLGKTKKEFRLEDRRLCGTIILKISSRTRMGECVLDLSGSGYGPVAVCFKQIIDIWGSIKCGGILLWLRSRR
jgi:hypothetical protein